MSSRLPRAPVIRPASYCGVCGFKPAHGRIPAEGVLPLAPSLDTVGFFTATARDMAAFWTRSFGRAESPGVRCAAHFVLPAAPEMTQAIDKALERWKATGLRVNTIDLPAGWDELLRATRVVNDYEGARTHEARYREYGERIEEHGLHIWDAWADESLRVIYDPALRLPDPPSP